MLKRSRTVLEKLETPESLVCSCATAWTYSKALQLLSPLDLLRFRTTRVHEEEREASNSAAVRDQSNRRYIIQGLKARLAGESKHYNKDIHGRASLTYWPVFSFPLDEPISSKTAFVE